MIIHCLSFSVPACIPSCPSAILGNCCSCLVSESIFIQLSWEWYFAEEIRELREAEKAKGRKPDPVIDALLKAETIEGAKESVVTEYMLKLLGLDVSLDPCSVQSINSVQPCAQSRLVKQFRCLLCGADLCGHGGG